MSHCGRHSLNDPNNPYFLIFMILCSFLPLDLVTHFYKANTVIRCHFWDMSLQNRWWLVLGMLSFFYLLYVRKASCLVVSWHEEVHLELREASSQQEQRPSVLEELNPTKSQARNLGSRSFLVEASDETTAPAINLTTTSWDTWVWGTNLRCTQIPDLKNCETMLL